jgi:(S)-2-hydroxyglutarate dehydrogenase
MQRFDFIVVGGGIVGLSAAHAILLRQPNARMAILEKETEWACHQTGRNSGVIHSGIYYKPGSLKAKFARQGCQSMVEFCREHGIRHEICGKVIVATKTSESPLLENLFNRGLENELPVSKLSAEQVKEIEPHVRCVAGIKVPTTGIVDYKSVCAKLVELLKNLGATLVLGAKVERVLSRDGCYLVESTQGAFETNFLVNCAGLHSDRVAASAGGRPSAKIIPFRGEYYELIPEKRHMVKTLIYPVPDPNFPFLGVHFTKMIDGSVHAGPNAVLAFKREGYHKTDFSLRDTLETLTFPGFWKLARKHRSEAWMEMRRSFSKKLFVRSLQELIPEVQEADVVPTHAGVRAQALMPDGKLVDDFLFVEKPNALHVCNAPSPAATASIEIGRAIADRVSLAPVRTTVSLASRPN